MEYDNTNSGAVFINAEKEELKNTKDTSKWPDFKGSVDVEGVEYWASVWRRQIKQGQSAGKWMLSLKLKKKEDRGSGEARTETQAAVQADTDKENCPF
jgi:hypothetical protein